MFQQTSHSFCAKNFLLLKLTPVYVLNEYVLREEKSSLRYTKAFCTKLCRMVLRKMYGLKKNVWKEENGRDRRGKGKRNTYNILKKKKCCSLECEWKLDWRNHIVEYKYYYGYYYGYMFESKKYLPILCVPTFTSFHFSNITLFARSHLGDICWINGYYSFRIIIHVTMPFLWDRKSF